MDSFYEITNETKAVSAVMTPGINENVKLLDIVRENSKDDGSGTEVLRFYFEDSQGRGFTHTEFPIDVENLKKLAKNWSNTTPEEAVKKAFNDMGAKIKHILGAFMPEDQVVITGVSGWEGYCDKVIELAAKQFEGQLYRIKVVLNKKDFNSFPRTAVAPFVQNMEEQNTLTINPKYDRIVPLAATAEDQYDDGLDGDDDESFEDEF